MSYKKGTEVLPAHLLKEVQRYIDGSFIYIPKTSKKVGWGSLSGARESLEERNNKIIKLFESGLSISFLAEKFFLSEETIKKIVYSKKQL